MENNEADVMEKRGAKNPNLGEKRFAIDKESLGEIREFDKLYKSLKEVNPEVKGLGFFGSRLVRQNSPESDLDMVIFYDGTRISYPEEKFIKSSSGARINNPKFDPIKNDEHGKNRKKP